MRSPVIPIATWLLRLRWKRVLRDRMLAASSGTLLTILGFTFLPRGVANAERLHRMGLDLPPEGLAALRSLVAGAAFFIGVVSGPRQNIPASFFRFPVSDRQRFWARILAEIFALDWMLVWIVLGAAPLLVAGMGAGVHSTGAASAAVLGALLVWPGVVGLGAILRDSPRLVRRDTPLGGLAAAAILAWIAALAVCIVRPIEQRTLTTAILPAAWPGTWWARAVDAANASQPLPAVLWLLAIAAASMALVLLATLVHVRAPADAEANPARRTRFVRPSRWLLSAPPRPFVLAAAEQSLAYRRDPVHRSALASAFGAPILISLWMFAGRASVAESSRTAFLVLGLAAAFGMSALKGSSVALDGGGLRALRLFPAPLSTWLAGRDAMQWILTAVWTTLSLATAAAFLGTTHGLFASWGLALALAWAFLSAQHAIACFFPFRVERSADVMGMPAMASFALFALCAVFAVPVLIVRSRWGDAAAVAAALATSVLVYPVSLRVCGRQLAQAEPGGAVS